MKTEPIPLIARRWLAVILALVLLAWVGVAGAAAPLDEQLIEAAARGDLAQVGLLRDKGADVNAEMRDVMTVLRLTEQRVFPQWATGSNR